MQESITSFRKHIQTYLGAKDYGIYVTYPQTIFKKNLSMHLCINLGNFTTPKHSLPKEQLILI